MEARFPPACRVGRFLDAYGAAMEAGYAAMSGSGGAEDAFERAAVARLSDGGVEHVMVVMRVPVRVDDGGSGVSNAMRVNATMAVVNLCPDLQSGFSFSQGTGDAIRSDGPVISAVWLHPFAGRSLQSTENGSQPTNNSTTAGSLPDSMWRDSMCASRALAGEWNRTMQLVALRQSMDGEGFVNASTGGIMATDVRVVSSPSALSMPSLSDLGHQLASFHVGETKHGSARYSRNSLLLPSMRGPIMYIHSYGGDLTTQHGGLVPSSIPARGGVAVQDRTM